MGNEERKGRGRKWALRIALLVIIILLLLKCSGNRRSMLSGGGGEHPSKEKQRTPHVSALAPPPPQEARSKEQPAHPEVPLPVPASVASTPEGERSVPVKDGGSEKEAARMMGKIQRKSPPATGSVAGGPQMMEPSPKIGAMGERTAGAITETFPDQAPHESPEPELEPPEEQRSPQKGLRAGSGRPGTLLGGGAARSASSASGRALTVSVPASVTVPLSFDKGTAVLKEVVSEAGRGESGGGMQQNETPALRTGRPGPLTAVTDPAPGPNEVQPDRMMGGGAADTGDLPEVADQRRIDLTAIKEADKAEKERASESGALVQANEDPLETASIPPGPNGGTETLPLQPQGPGPEGKGGAPPVRKSIEESAESNPLQTQKEAEEFPDESPGYPEGGFMEEAILDAEYVPMCPGKPAVEGVAAKGESPAGKTFVDSVTGISFVLVKGGCFEMGSNAGGRDERPVHEVCVDDFYMGEYEVTQAQYEWIMKHNPSAFKSCGLPVESVSWEDAQTYIGKLKEASGRNYRLPSEAEWEYAARSGWRDEAKPAVDEALLMDYAGYVRNMGMQSGPDSGPNGWGLYDMSGNVWEWVSDWYGSKYYASSPRRNPQGPPSGAHRVLKAGTDGRHEAQYAKRYGAAPDESRNYFGFRIVFSAEGPPEARKVEVSDSAAPNSTDGIPVSKEVDSAAGPVWTQPVL